jgi:tetratricopeptide (TPR) repeat protein
MSKIRRNPKKGGESKGVWLAGLALAAGTLACYWAARHFDYVNIDDPLYVYQNRMVRRGLSWPGFVWAWQCLAGGNWNPLVWLSHMADCQIYGLKAGGHHLTNLLLHTANVLLFFAVLRRMTGAVWRSALAAAIFAWHPMHVESVAWISERKDVLSALFFLSALWAYAGFVQGAGRRRRFFYALALLCFALGLASKPMLVTLPLIFLLLDYWPLRRMESIGRLIVEKLPFLVLSLAAGVVAVLAQNRVGSINATALNLRLENALVSGAVYLQKLFWPVDLAVFYPYPHTISVARWGAALFLLGAISWAALWQKNKRPYLATGWFLFLITLLPVIGVVQVGMQARADRYTYIPYIGLGIMIGWGLADLVKTWPRQKVAWVAVAVSGLAACLAATGSQLNYWRDNEALWRRNLSVTSDNYVANENLGIALGEKGESEDAIKYLREAVRINPQFSSTHFNLGRAYALQHRMEEAIAEEKESLRLAPDNEKALNALAWFYATSPEAGLRNGAEAVRLATRACKITKQEDPAFLDTLAAAYAEEGRFEEASKITQEILAQAESVHDTPMVDMARQRLVLYHAGKPCRE